MHGSNDTIAFIATPKGEGGIGVVQVSGLRALELVGRLFRSKSASGNVDLTMAPSGSLFYGTMHDSAGVVDEVLVSVWRSEKSFTGEDLVEISCHGGIMPVQKTMEALLGVGAREGTWEELLDRACIRSNDRTTEGKSRLNLVQREALLLLPKAKTRLAVKMLLTQYQSGIVTLSNEVERLEGKVRGLKTKIMDCNTSEVAYTLSSLLVGLKSLLDSSSFGLALITPLKISIAGVPNVGKSTLFNALLREERALVHPEPGTTRDYISEYLSVEGIPLELIDTAGLREAEGVERVGVRWASGIHGEAYKVILVLDASRAMTEEEKKLISTLDRLKVIPVLNKIDLGLESDVGELESLFDAPVCAVSALDGRGLKDLERMLVQEFLPEIDKGCHRPIIFTQRQKRLLIELLNMAREIPQNVADCFTASEVCDKLKEIETFLHSILWSRV